MGLLLWDSIWSYCGSIVVTLLSCCFLIHPEYLDMYEQSYDAVIVENAFCN